MATARLTKNELKREKDSLKRFERYLPTLLLKKQQLQIVVRQAEARERELLSARNRVTEELNSWIAAIGEAAVGSVQAPSLDRVPSLDPAPAFSIRLESLVHVRELTVGAGNIAGVDIPVFEEIAFDPVPYDLFIVPLWVDAATDRIAALLRIDAERQIISRQRELLAEELRLTTQRVNLFEKVKIPETRENIRRIRIYLGDEQTASVVRGKIAKRNLSRRVEG